MKTLLHRFDHLFANSGAKILGTTVVTHKIKLSDDTPFQHKDYWVPNAQREQLVRSCMGCCNQLSSG